MSACVHLRHIPHTFGAVKDWEKGGMEVTERQLEGDPATSGLSRISLSTLFMFAGTSLIILVVTSTILSGPLS